MDRLLLVAAAILFSTGGVAIKGNTFSYWQVASIRSGIAALFLLIIAPSARKALSWRLVPFAILYATTLICFAISTKLTTSANAIFLQSTTPLYLIFAGPVFLKERFERSQLYLTAALAFGLVFLFLGEQESSITAPNPKLGNWIAILAGVSWAGTIGGLRYLQTKHSSDNTTGAMVITGNLMACLIALPFALPVQSVQAADLAAVLYLGIFQISLAYLCMGRALRTVPAFEASTILLLELVLNPIWTWLFLGERPSALAMFGAFIIFVSTIANTWYHNRTETPSRNLAQ